MRPFLRKAGGEGDLVRIHLNCPSVQAKGGHYFAVARRQSPDRSISCPRSGRLRSVAAILGCYGQNAIPLELLLPPPCRGKPRPPYVPTPLGPQYQQPIAPSRRRPPRPRANLADGDGFPSRTAVFDSRDCRKLKCLLSDFRVTSVTSR